MSKLFGLAGGGIRTASYIFLPPYQSRYIEVPYEIEFQVWSTSVPITTISVSIKNGLNCKKVFSTKYYANLLLIRTDFCNT